MKNRALILSVGLVIFTGLFVSPASAEIGVAQALAEGGVSAVGTAVRNAAQAVYDSTEDPAVIQLKLTELINEAVATGDEGAIQYASVAVMMVGGAGKLPDVTLRQGSGEGDGTRLRIVQIGRIGNLAVDMAIGSRFS